MANKYKGLYDLTGKVVMSAGGAGAIGSEMASAMAAFGAKVAIADVAEDAATKVATELAESGAETMGVAINVLDEKSVAEAVGRSL